MSKRSKWAWQNGKLTTVAKGSADCFEPLVSFSKSIHVSTAGVRYSGLKGHSNDCDVPYFQMHLFS